MTNSSIYAAFERMWDHIINKFDNYVTYDVVDAKADTQHSHSAYDITSGVLDVARGGTGYSSITDTSYTTPRYRASTLVSYETTPYHNGTINWVYE